MLHADTHSTLPMHKVHPGLESATSYDMFLVVPDMFLMVPDMFLMVPDMFLVVPNMFLMVLPHCLAA